MPALLQVPIEQLMHFNAVHSTLFKLNGVAGTAASVAHCVGRPVLAALPLLQHRWPEFWHRPSLQQHRPGPRLGQQHIWPHIGHSTNTTFSSCSSIGLNAADPALDWDSSKRGFALGNCTGAT